MKTKWLFWVLTVLVVGAFLLVLGSAFRFGHESMRLQDEVDELQIQALARDLAVPQEALYSDWNLQQVVADARARTFWRHGTKSFMANNQLLDFVSSRPGSGHVWPSENELFHPDGFNTSLLSGGIESATANRATNCLETLAFNIEKGLGMGAYLKSHPAVYALRIRPLLMRLLGIYPSRDERLRAAACKVMVLLGDRGSDLSAAMESMARDEREFHRGEAFISNLPTMLRAAGWPELDEKIRDDIAALSAAEAKAEADRQSAAVFADRPPVMDDSGQPLPPGAVMCLGLPPLAAVVTSRVPLGDPALGHTRPVCSVSISSDGRRVATAGLDGTIIWDGQTGRLVRRIEKVGVIVRLSPDGALLACGQPNDSSLTGIIDVATGQVLWQDPLAKEGAQILAFSPDSRHVVMTTHGGSLRLCDARTGQRVRGFYGKHTSEIIGAAVSSDGSRLIAADHQVVTVWNIATGERSDSTTEVAGREPVMEYIRFSADGHAAVSSCDKRLRYWRLSKDDPAGGPDHNAEVLLRDGARIRTTMLPEYGWSIAISPDGRLAASGNKDGSVSVYSVALQEELLHLVGHQAAVGNLVFTPDGKRLVTAGYDRAVFVWDVGPAWKIANSPLPVPTAGNDPKKQ
jgi:hypothetical protein